MSYAEHPHHHRDQQPGWVWWPTLELPVTAPLWLESPTAPPAVPGRHRNGRWPGQRRPARVDVDAVGRAGQLTPVQAHPSRGSGPR
ncbi:hypothetical protein I0C86_31260 [Plantactinospora sp. S1510]|uniref:Uncharacterized protein n=1 Tax=Plantactinospora alkalitolerans TaxID=2789879 RepID=A0ABS0H4L6_9ACTN|nr:hypothetical protein [Plantactinospora alkalitolerans]MBF9133405.1 hypothetical protein [Plantactinospora alkalitolerans]